VNESGCNDDDDGGQRVYKNGSTASLLVVNLKKTNNPLEIVN